MLIESCGIFWKVTDTSCLQSPAEPCPHLSGQSYSTYTCWLALLFRLFPASAPVFQLLAPSGPWRTFPAELILDGTWRVPCLSRVSGDVDAVAAHIAFQFPRYLMGGSCGLHKQQQQSLQDGCVKACSLLCLQPITDESLGCLAGAAEPCAPALFSYHMGLQDAWPHDLLAEI